MYNQLMVGLLRRPTFFQSTLACQLLATRRGNTFDNLRVRALKYRGMAKQKRKETRRLSMGGVKSPKDTGEELPPFFLQPRYKLLYKVMQDHKNCARVARKPIPDAVKLELAKKSKEYHAYKVIEKAHIEQELNQQLKVQLKALDAIVFLPDYLMEECLSENGEQIQQDMAEFRPAVMYMEQMLRIYPREITCRWKILPSFEESLMRIEDSRMQDNK